MNFLHMEFNDIKFNIYSSDDVLEKLKMHWEVTLINVQYNLNIGDCWKIEIDLGNSDYTSVDKENKAIYYMVAKQGYINSINSFVREFIVKTSLAKGYIWLHASAFSINNKGIMVVGRKGSGKSTHLLNACLNYGAKIIGNDQNPLIIKDGKLLSYRWRPDAKFSISSLQVVGIEGPIQTETEKLIWMPEKQQIGTIDYVDLSKRRNQKILPYSNPQIKVAKSFECEITKILFLRDNQNTPKIKMNSMEKKDLIKELFENDDENINLEKFNNWKNKIPYWNKRVLGLKLEDKAINHEISTMEYIENKLECYQIYNRMDFNNEILHTILRG